MSGDSGVSLVEVENSALFNSANSEDLSRGSMSGTATTWTASFWVYRGVQGGATAKFMFTTSSDGGLAFASNSTADILSWYSGSYTSTTVLYRDVGWYHIVVKSVSGSGTVYVNGEAVLSSLTVNGADATMAIGSYNNGSNHFDGYMAEWVFIDGTAYNPTSFAEYDETGLYWTPKSSDDIKALTFGNNGFYLDNTTNAQTDAHLPAPAVVLPTVTFDGTNDYLTRGADYTGNADSKLFSMSMWVKRTGGEGALQLIHRDGSSSVNSIDFNTANKFHIVNDSVLDVTSARTITISDGWTHIMCAYNNGTATFQLYIDGVVDSASVAVHNNANTNWTHSDHAFGGTVGGANLLNAEIADFYFNNAETIDLSSSSNRAKFITTDGYPVDLGSDGSTPTGTAPRVYLNNALATWHTNLGTGGGMTETGALTAGSAVQSVNSNSFINNNTVVTTTHTPSNSFATINPLQRTTDPINLSNGNLTGTFGATGSHNTAISTIPLTTGKWYFEMTYVTDPGGYCRVGVVGPLQVAASNYLGQLADGYGYVENGTKVNSGTAPAYGSTWAAADVIGVYVDMDNGAIWFSKNGTLQNSATQGEIEAGTTTNAAYTGITGTVWAAASQANNGSAFTFNFGASTLGTALYTGYGEINTTNLAAATTRTETVNDHFQTQLVAHNGSSTAFTLGWNADTYQTLFIAKNRDSTEKWFWVDGVRGYNKYFSSDAGTAQTTDANVISVSGTTITLGSTLASAAYVVECFRLGTSSVAADAGTINAVVSVNTVMNWSVILYTGNNAASQTVEHGLSGTPKMFIGENVGGTTAGGYYFEALGNTAIMALNVPNAKSTSSGYLQNTSPTSSVISVGANATFNASGNENWLFAVGSGSDFVANGSYEGNGNANGTFIPTIGGNGVPLQPLFALQLSIDSSGARMMHDSKREGYNVDNDELSFESTGAEGTANQIDIVSGGIKNRIATDPNVAETNVYFAIGTPIIDVDGRIIAGR
jgi:hypothetical protein